MKKTSKRFLVPMALMLCMALLFSSFAPVTAFAATDKKILSTTGEAIIEVIPDLAVLTLGVQSTDKTAKLAYADNKVKMTAILKELARLGIEKKDIKTSTFTVSPSYEWVDNTNKLVGYTVTNMVTVKVRDLDKVGEILESAILQDSNAINGLEYKVADNTKNYKAALRIAVRDAKEKAVEMASELGYEKITPITVRENSSSIVTPIYYDKATLAASEAAPVSSGTLEIRATVTIDFQY